MKLVAPRYYESFRCKGGKCKSNCCIGWEIDIDSRTLEKYSRARGALGEKIRKSISRSGEVSHFCLKEDERCPHLNSDNLCDIIIGLGEEYLSDICREHPRYYLTLGDTVYGGVGLSCEAAAELILGEKTPHGYREYSIEGFEPEECDAELCDVVLSYRKRIADGAARARSPLELLATSAELALMLQGEIDGEKIEVDPLTCHETGEIYKELSKIFGELEYMKDGLYTRLCTSFESMGASDGCSSAEGAVLSEELRLQLSNIFIYFIDRYLPYAVCDGDAVGAVFLAALSYAAICSVIVKEGRDPEGLLRLAVDYSAEIEYSEENVERIKSSATAELLSLLPTLFK